MLSIIIINYKTSKDIIRCLNSIIEFEKNYKKYEIIIVDNNSNDNGLANIAKDFKFVKIIYAPKNGGFAYGNNIGIKNSKGDHILLLNPDTYLFDNSIEKLYERMLNDPGIDIIGPKLLNPDMSNQIESVAQTYPTLWRLFCHEFYLNRIFKNSKILNSYFQTYADYDKERLVEQINGAVFMFKKSLLEKIGLLDEDYFMFFEETDFCLKAIRNGGKLLYYPESKIIHIGGQVTSFGSYKRYKDYIDSLKFFLRKNFGKATSFWGMFFIFIGSSIRLILLRLFFNRKYIIYFYYIKAIFNKKS